MRRASSRLAAAVLLVTAGSASALELNYKWKKGDVHRFRYEDDSTMEMKMPGGMGMPGMQMPGMNMGAGGMTVQMKVQSVFSQKVLAVRPDGTAEVELTLEKLDFRQGDQSVTALKQIPPAARKVKAEVDRKGHAKFFRMVTLYVQEGRTMVGVHNLKAGPHGASASMSAGDMRVDVVAAVDPKTGSVTLAMQEKKVPPALKAVTIKEEDPAVDVIPKDIFEMMVLPEGPGHRPVLEEHVNTIFEACAFQDITGQRITKVVDALQSFEQRLDRFIGAVRARDAHISDPAERARRDRAAELMLNGPQDSEIATSQDDIDALFA